jgi:hypothetical protein
MLTGMPNKQLTHSEHKRAGSDRSIGRVRGRRPHGAHGIGAGPVNNHYFEMALRAAVPRSFHTARV